MGFLRAAIPLTALVLVMASPAAAEERPGDLVPHHAAPGSEADASPYADQQHRAVKALSEQQLADLRSGRGMGLALPAELNGYPGPRHVLDLGDELQLSAEQRTRTEILFEAMRAETIPIGERIIAEEAALDRLFAERQITPAELDAITQRIGAAQGALRAAHLRSHLQMMDVLTSAQVFRYAELRGYAGGGHHGMGVH